MLGVSEYAQILVALLAILNPLVAVPSFVALTSDESRRNRRRIALVTSFAVFALLCAAALLGQAMLQLFRISISAFRVGGGVLVLLTAISMIQARVSTSKQTPEEFREAADKESIAVVPLAIPMLAGPGSLSTIIVYSHQVDGIAGLQHKFVLCSLVFIVSLVVLIVLSLSNRVGKALGTTGMNIVSRLMGLLLAAIGVQFIAEGIKGLFPGVQ